MYQIKNRIYLNFDKTQKSGICNYLRALVKQNSGLTCSEIMDKFLDDEKYYLEINASRFPFLADVIDDSVFLKDTEDYITQTLLTAICPYPKRLTLKRDLYRATP